MKSCNWFMLSKKLEDAGFSIGKMICLTYRSRIGNDPTQTCLDPMEFVDFKLRYNDVGFHVDCMASAIAVYSCSHPIIFVVTKKAKFLGKNSASSLNP